MDILRFITAGSVDDGKSTLIGRLLYDSKNILIDQLAAIERASKQKHNGTPDLALLTDGLRAEREQGITIDVAYKYFSTPRRKFIIADAPGHVQYTRNMITGASNADLIIVLVDARKGIVEQTRRHSIIAALLHLPHVVVAVNKLDLVDYSEQVFWEIVAGYALLAGRLGLKDVTYIPISALNGDNVVEPSEHLHWYRGPALLQHLETVTVVNTADQEHARFPVQYVIRPQTGDYHDYRGYAGKIISGRYRRGDKVKVLPSGIETTLLRIESNGREYEEVSAPQSVVLHLDDAVDVSRGDQIVKEDAQLRFTQDITVLLCWMDSKPLRQGNTYLLQHNSTLLRGRVTAIEYKLDVNTLERLPVNEAGLNDVVKVTVRTAAPFAHDSYAALRANGGLIFIDETSHITVGAGLIG